MALAAGTKLGPYEVLSLLGAGGMGEVYRARDSRLNRDVALKVLHADRMADENRRRRFVREARAASALNHPNIVIVHDVDSIDGIDFIVMEYVPGKSLAALVPGPGMPLKDVLRIAIPIADALARAHAAGIVHRDLKPANVVVRSDGAVKVLDFGLAKLVTLEPGSPDQDTLSEEDDEDSLSRAGTVVGTAGYMSPEQAMGKEVDARSDVFSLGSVLYEMVTGRRAFAGSSRAETLAAVVRDQPQPPSDVVPSVPQDFEKLIQRCLRKEPERRFQHMLDVKLELEQIEEDSDSQAAVSPVGVRRSRPRGLLVAVAVAVVLILGGGAWRLSRPTGATLPAPQVVPLTTLRGEEFQPTFSPDGDQVAFSWNGEKLDNADIYAKMIGSSEMHRLTTDPAEDGSPSWAPDGRQIAFVRTPVFGGPGTIHLVSRLGGSDRKLSDFPVDGYGQLSWSPDGRWLAAARTGSASETAPDDGGLYLIPLQGGEPRLLMRAPLSGANTVPAFSPDGLSLAYASGDVHVVELGSDFVPTSPPRRLTRQGLHILSLTWARDGASIVYAAEQGPDTEYLWRVVAQGDRPPERIEMAGHRASELAIAPVGHRLAFSSGLFDTDICRFEPGQPAQVVLSSSFYDGSPRFSPDGRRIAFESLRSGERTEIWLAAADGSNPEPLLRGPGRAQGSPDWSPDGGRIAFDSQGEDGHRHIWTIDAEGGTPRRLTQDPGDETAPTWSQDGRWVYFFSARDGGLPEVWRVPAATGGVEERVTHGGADAGSHALESSDGKALFFRRRATDGSFDGSLLALPLAGGPERTLVAHVWTFTAGAGAVYYTEGRSTDPMLHRLDPATGQDQAQGKLEKIWGQIAVSPDGKAILYTKIVSEGSDLMLIENFR